ncbi:UNKNOWN [Stylonychia lemnae]|uniref:Uncharacterized protein n=1 Tax=Stylonychia lemnae TaxID=5949 RepID=A0A078ARE8_STYLE|nr:UNKNOWN [Stylonychia lemnae]|eukprot:CDW84556.1 UNKNOWN [Stylonychia lemnae]
MNAAFKLSSSTQEGRFPIHQKRKEQRGKSKSRPYMLDSSPSRGQNTTISNQSNVTPISMNLSMEKLNQSTERPNTSSVIHSQRSMSKSKRPIQPFTPSNNKQNYSNHSTTASVKNGFDQQKMKAKVQQKNTSRNHNMTTISPPKIMHNSSTNLNRQSKDQSISQQSFIVNNQSILNQSLSTNTVEQRLIQYAKVYENKRSKLVEQKVVREREPSKEKPDINSSSDTMVEQKKQKIFEQMFQQINSQIEYASGTKQTQTSQFVDPATANYRSLPIQVMDIMMDVFTDFEEGQRPWNQEKFVQKCNEVYTKIPPGDRSELIKLYNPKIQTRNAKRGDSKSKYQVILQQQIKILLQPEINQNSVQMCMNNRQYGTKACENLYQAHEQQMRKKEQLKEELEKERMKQCTFKPLTYLDIEKQKSNSSSNGSAMQHRNSIKDSQRSQRNTESPVKTKTSQKFN